MAAGRTKHRGGQQVGGPYARINISSERRSGATTEDTTTYFEL